MILNLVSVSVHEVGFCEYNHHPGGFQRGFSHLKTSKIISPALIYFVTIEHFILIHYIIENCVTNMSLASSVRFMLDLIIVWFGLRQMYESGTSLRHPQISPIESSGSRFYGHTNPSLPTTSHCSVDPLDSVLRQNLPIQHPPPLNSSFPQNHPSQVVRNS